MFVFLSNFASELKRSLGLNKLASLLLSFLGWLKTSVRYSYRIASFLIRLLNDELLGGFALKIFAPKRLVYSFSNMWPQWWTNQYLRLKRTISTFPGHIFTWLIQCFTRVPDILWRNYLCTKSRKQACSPTFVFTMHLVGIFKPLQIGLNIMETRKNQLSVQRRLTPTVIVYVRAPMLVDVRSKLSKPLGSYTSQFLQTNCR